MNQSINQSIKKVDIELLGQLKRTNTRFALIRSQLEPVFTWPGCLREALLFGLFTIMKIMVMMTRGERYYCSGIVPPILALFGKYRMYIAISTLLYRLAAYVTTRRMLNWQKYDGDLTCAFTFYFCLSYDLEMWKLGVELVLVILQEFLIPGDIFNAHIFLK